MSDIENNNGQLEEVKTQMKNLVADCKTLYTNFSDKKSQVLQLKGGPRGSYSSAAWGDTTWGNSESVDETTWPADTAPIESTQDTSGVIKYRALYEFRARNQDEISFQPGDIILVSICEKILIALQTFARMAHLTNKFLYTIPLTNASAILNIIYKWSCRLHQYPTQRKAGSQEKFVDTQVGSQEVMWNLWTPCPQ